MDPYIPLLSVFASIALFHLLYSVMQYKTTNECNIFVSLSMLWLQGERFLHPNIPKTVNNKLKVFLSCFCNFFLSSSSSSSFPLTIPPPPTICNNWKHNRGISDIFFALNRLMRHIRGALSHDPIGYIENEGLKLQQQKRREQQWRTMGGSFHLVLSTETCCLLRLKPFSVHNQTCWVTCHFN